MHPDHWRLFRRIQILDLIPVRLVPDGHRQPFVYKGAATRFSINPSPTPYSALNTVGVTREKGIVLAGPDPRELIDEVSAEALRIEMREKFHRAAMERPPDPAAIDSRWLQAFLVILYCRMLHTLETGTVVSKKAASQWA